MGNYGDHQQQAIRYNDATPAYIWYATTKSPLPTGEFASVATRPYDQQAYGDITVYAPVAYGHYNGMEFELERRFSKGFAYQILWNVGNSIWIGRDNVDVPGSDTVPSINTFLPGAVPSDFDARLRFLNYARGPNSLKHQIRWNYLWDVPVGAARSCWATPKASCNMWWAAGRSRDSETRGLPTGHCRPISTRRATLSKSTATSIRSRIAKADLLPGLSLVEWLHSRE